MYTVTRCLDEASAPHIYAIIRPVVVGHISLENIVDNASSALIVGIVMSWANHPFTAIFDVNFAVSMLETQDAN